MFIFFTQAIRKGVVDKNGVWVGMPYDFLVSVGEAYPRIHSLVASRGRLRRKYATIPWENIQRTDDNYKIKETFASLEFASDYRRDSQISVKRHILDQQVVDTYNRKLVRVNDIHLLKVGNDLRIAHVDIGIRGIVRRLGWQRWVDFIVRMISPHATYLIREGFLSWKYVQPLSINQDQGLIQLNVDQEQIKSIPPPDMSEMFLELDPYQRGALFRSLDIDTQVEIITEMDMKHQKQLMRVLDTKACVMLFERMPSDEATDLLGELSRKDADRILTSINTKKAKKLSKLLTHRSDSAGGLMITEYVSLADTMTVAEAIDHIKNLKTRVEMIYYTYIVDAENHLLGVVTFRHLLLAPLDQKLTDLMQQNPIGINVNASAKEVAYILDKYNLLAVPVIDNHRVLQGMITVDDVLSLVIAETWGKKTGLL